MAEAYRVKADTTFPTAVRKVDELIDGQEVYETVGVPYAEGEFLLAEALTPRDRERAENGDLDHLLEPADKEEAEGALNPSEKGVFIAEHAAEAFILNEYGHEVVPKDQVLELKSAGADAAQEAQDAAKADGADERDLPGLPQEPVEDTGNLEQPPGVVVGEAKVAAETTEAPAPKGRARKATSNAKQQKVAEEAQAKSE